MNREKDSVQNPDTIDYPFPVPTTRFDQKNEMFKRRAWDEKIMPHAHKLYYQVKYQDKHGYRKLDYALRNASWNLEYGFGYGTMRSDYGLYSWTDVAEKAKRFIETGGPVTHTPEDHTRIVKKAARVFGADLVGLCRVHPNLIYSHEYDLLHAEHRPLDLPEGCTHAIVMAIAMDYDTMKYSPDAIAGTATGLGYSKMAFLTNLVAAFIRGLGYRAIPSGNDTGLSIPLAMAAGLGELGRNGLLITEKYGPRVRICKVFTDLPLVHDTYRPFGVAQFCESCKKCADHCPSGAITHDEPTTQGPSFSNHSGVEKWYIDPERCFLFWVKNWMDCSQCIKVCPFNKPQGFFHDAARVVIRKMPRFNRALIWMDDLLGYGKPVKSNHFWDT